MYLKKLEFMEDEEQEIKSYCILKTISLDYNNSIFKLYSNNLLSKNLIFITTNS